MLFLDYTQIKYCKLQSKDKTTSGIIYNDRIFTRAKAYPQEELDLAIKECREEYLDHEERSKIPTLLIKERKGIGIWMENKRYKKEDILNISGDEKPVTPESSKKINRKSGSDVGRISIRQIASQMSSEQGVEVKTRRHKLKLYPRCFLGNEAVDWIVDQIKVSREDAVRIGQKMLEKGLLEHVTQQHTFKDKNLFYRFNENKK